MKITDTEKQWFAYAYKCGQTDALQQTRTEHKSMISNLFEHAERYEQETGQSVDVLWFEFFYLSGAADYLTGHDTFADLVKHWFVDDPQEEKQCSTN